MKKMLYLNYMPKFLSLNSKGFTPIITLLLVMGGIFATVYLVQHAPLVFNPKADSKVLDIQAAGGTDEKGNPCRVYEENGKKKTNCKQVKLNILSPGDVSAGVTFPSSPTSPVAGCVDNPDPSKVLSGYKWVADCSKTCTDNTECPKNSVQGSTGFVCPASSNWCYDFGGNVGKRCLMNEYIGPQTGGPAGLYSDQECADKTKLTYSCVQGPAGSITATQADCVVKARPDVLKTYTETKKWCSGVDNQRAIVNNWINSVATSADKNDSKVKACLSTTVAQPSNDALQFVVAESEGELQTNSWENYTSGNVSKVFPFTPPPTVSETRYIYLRFRKGSTPVGQNYYREIIEYVKPTGANEQPASGNTVPSASATTVPASGSTVDTNLSGVLYVKELKVSPTSVKKDASGNYSKIHITVKDANKPWQIYFQNKTGASCGGTCDLEQWTVLNALKGAEGGSGSQGTTTFAWTPQSDISGIHTIALIDVAAGKIIKAVDMTFGNKTSSSTRSTTQVTVSPNPVIKDSSGSYPIITVSVKNADRNWTIYYNEQGCGGGCDPKVGWTEFSRLTTGGSGEAGKDTSFTWAPYSWISGTHTFAIVDTNTNQIISPLNVNFYEYGYVPTRSDD